MILIAFTVNWKCPSIGHMRRFIESFTELVSKGYFLSFKRWKFNHRWFVFSIGGLMQGMEQITSFSDGWGYFAHFFICMKSHHSWILARRPTSSWCDPLQWEGISYDSPSPPSRTKVQFRRNLNWQFEVDYFGTWNIHFSTISVKNWRTAGIIASVFSRKPLEFIQIRTFVFSHVSLFSPIYCSRFRRPTLLESVSNCWNGSTDRRGLLAMPVGHLVDVIRFAGTCASFDLLIS